MRVSEREFWNSALLVLCWSGFRNSVAIEGFEFEGGSLFGHAEGRGLFCELFVGSLRVVVDYLFRWHVICEWRLIVNLWFSFVCGVAGLLQLMLSFRLGRSFGSVVDL